jgi:hypothetical protein
MTPIDGAKPILFHGLAVREFLKERNVKRKQPCGPGKLYCFRCRVPRPAAGGVAEYVAVSAKSGNIRAICETCETVMHRRVSRSALVATMPGIGLQIPEHPLRLIGSLSPSPNCDSKRQAAA